MRRWLVCMGAVLVVLGCAGPVRQVPLPEDLGVPKQLQTHQAIVTLATANFVEGGEQTFDQDSHGTAVAGVIAARADNSIGIFGIAPEAEIIALKACWQRARPAPGALCSSWTLAKAVDFAVQSGAQVLNFSLAGPPDPLLARLIATAVHHHITIVAAVLEEGERGPGFPASLETVIAICSSDPRGYVHSTVGGKTAVALAAPGVDILTTAPHEAYDFLSGSSLAAAHVTGIVALLLEQEPHLTPAQIQALLRTTAQPSAGAASPTQGTLGIVDACAALERLVGAQLCS